MTFGQIKLRKPVRIGCAITVDQVIAVGQTGKARIEAAIAVRESDASPHERVATAFGEAVLQAMRSAPSGNGHVRVSVAVMPPLAQVRLIDLPPMRPEERAKILTRDARRYFFGAREPQVATGMSIGRQGARRVVAAAVPESLLDALKSAVPDNAQIDAIVPAASAWAAASNGAPDIEVVASDARYVLSFKKGRIVFVGQRRVDSDGPDSDAVHRFSWVEAAWSAAANASRARDLRFLTMSDWKRLRERQNRRVRTAAAGVLLVFTAGAAAMHGALRHEITEIRAQRAALRPSLLPALASVDSLQRINERLAEIHTMQRGPRWSVLVPMIAKRLPADVQLVYIIGSSDSLMLRVNAHAAADVLPELRDAPLLQNVRIAGAIERDVSDPEATTEQFDVAAHIRPPQVQ